MRPGETVIRLATYTSRGISGAIEQWEREHPTATVVIDRRDFDDHHSTILEPRADTVTPDIVAFDASYSARFRNRPDLLVDLRQFGTTTMQDAALTWRWGQGVTDDGRVIGIPVDVGAMALAYRVDLVGPEIAETLAGAESWCDLLVAGDAYSDLTSLPFLPRAAARIFH